MRFEKASVTFSGALRDDVSGAHAFIFMRRRGRTWFLSVVTWAPCTSDIPSNMEIRADGPGLRSLCPAVDDIVCCVKRYFADPGLSQESL